MNPSWPLPQEDPWSTPFAESLLAQLKLHPGLTILDVASGDGIPAFYLAEQVGPTGRVLAIDLSQAQIRRARFQQGSALPWLEFVCMDLRALPSTLPSFDRITGNISFMFFRPNRFEALQGLVSHLKPGGQVVLTFPSLGTFDSLWERIDREMAHRHLVHERQALADYVAERPSAAHVTQWLEALKLEQIVVAEDPLEVKTGPGPALLHHPILRGGFLDDVYDCFQDQALAEKVMATVSDDITSFVPLLAIRCTMSARKPHDSM